RVRHVAPTFAVGGVINITVAGSANAQTGNSGDGGPLLAARFSSLSGIVLYADPFNPSDIELVVSDRADHTLRKLNLTTDKVTLVGGQHGQPGFGGGIDV